MKKKLLCLLIATVVATNITGCGAVSKFFTLNHNVVEEEKEEKQKKAKSIEFEAKTTADDKEYFVLTGYDRKGNELWSYISDEYYIAELNNFEDVGKIDTGYVVIEAGIVKCFDLYDGSIIWETRKNVGSGNSFVIDENDNIIISGYYGPDLTIVSPDGDIIDSAKNLINDDFFWPVIEGYENNILTVHYYNSDVYAYLTIEDGEIIDIDCDLESNTSTNYDFASKYAEAVYNDFISNAGEYYDPLCYQFIYLNDDDIPELAVCEGNWHGAGVKIYTIYDDEVVDLDYFGSSGACAYIPYEGYLCSSYMGSGAVWYGYYQLIDGEVITLNTLSSYEDCYMEEDLEEMEETELYFIDDVGVTRSEYNNLLDLYDEEFEFDGIYYDYMNLLTDDVNITVDEIAEILNSGY